MQSTADGDDYEQLYCQNLCLFAKLFIEHKYVFYDVRGNSVGLFESVLTEELRSTASCSTC